MKILTLNAHALPEENAPRRLSLLAEFILLEQPDIIALQESNQSASAPAAGRSLREGMFPLPGVCVPVKTDNHAAWLSYVLRRAGISCSWAWLPVKLGYGRLDEGAAVISLHSEIAEADVQLLSGRDDYLSWKTRRALGVRLADGADWYYSVHMGWWDDAEEPFAAQWAALGQAVSGKAEKARVWLAGDFNAPAERRGESYDAICADGWLDTWILAKEKRGCATVSGAIDGWKSGAEGGFRLDHVFVNRNVHVLRASVVFDGLHEAKISDHAGVLIEI